MPDRWTKAIIDFWFDELEREQWYKRDEALDRQIVERFGETYEAARQLPVPILSQSPQTSVASVIVLDQFPRNMFRGSPRTFESDALALAVAEAALAAGHDGELDADQRQFLYMPFMHSEELAHQDRCVELFTTLGKDEPLKYAHLHRDVIAKFDRFPHRNAVLGRETTPDEKAHLDEHGGF